MVLLGLAIGPASAAAQAPKPAAVDKAMDAAHDKVRTIKEGKNADYIPALAEVDPNLFGLALVTVGGKVYTRGDAEALFSIQSISTVFTMALVMQESWTDAVLNGVGVDATGQRFNSSDQREREGSGSHRTHRTKPSDPSRPALKATEPRALRPGRAQPHRGTLQSSTSSPGTRVNSAELFVTRMHPQASACAAISMSRSPIRCPIPSIAARRSP